MRTLIHSFAVLALLFFASPADAQPSQSKPEEPMKLIYVFDPLCGWCYGF